jgi:hypothetical protein
MRKSFLADTILRRIYTAAMTVERPIHFWLGISPFNESWFAELINNRHEPKKKMNGALQPCSIACPMVLCFSWGHEPRQKTHSLTKVQVLGGYPHPLGYPLPPQSCQFVPQRYPLPTSELSWLTSELSWLGFEPNWLSFEVSQVRVKPNRLGSGGS